MSNYLFFFIKNYINMLICKKNDKFYIFLANPKCASSLLQEIILKTTNGFVIHYGSKSITECNNNVNDINYNHCSLQGAIEYIQNNNLKRDDVIIISTIRNPYTRAISQYYWYLKSLRLKYFKIDNDLNEDIKCYLINERTRWTSYNKPKTFRTYLNYTVDDVLRIEYLSEDLEMLNKKYGLDIVYNQEKSNVNNYNKNIVLNNEVKEMIYNDYELDFIDGNYEK